MMTDRGLKVIEFNARFGDPEGIMALIMLSTNFYTLCYELSLGKLESPLEFGTNDDININYVPTFVISGEPYCTVNVYQNDTLILDNLTAISGNIQQYQYL